MRDSDLAEIRSLSLFHGMDPAHFHDLMRGAYNQSFPPQVTLIEEGQRADFLHVITDGAVEMFARWNDRETTMAVARPVSTFVLAACINDAPYLMSARTLVPAQIVMIPGADLRAVFARDAVFAQAIVRELAGCYRSVVRHAKNLKLRASRERLAAYLIRQAKSTVGPVGFQLQIEKRLLASYLGMTPENLSRTLRLLRDDGVTVDGLRVEIRDLAKLAAIALPDPLMDGPENCGEPGSDSPSGVGTTPA